MYNLYLIFTKKITALNNFINSIIKRTNNIRMPKKSEENMDNNTASDELPRKFYNLPTVDFYERP